MAGELTRIEAGLFDAEWAEAKARLGREPGTDDLNDPIRARSGAAEASSNDSG